MIRWHRGSGTLLDASDRPNYSFGYSVYAIVTFATPAASL